MEVELRPLKLHIEGKDFEAVLSVPMNHQPVYGVILTHGAGGSLESGELPPLAQYLATHGILCLRFTCRGLNIKYRIKIYQKIVEEVLSLEEFKLKGIFLGGRSMGSRAAVGVANGSTESELHKHILGVICLAYPLIGSNNGDVRDGPLFELTVPCIFISGDRDPMCPMPKLEETRQKMKCGNDVCSLPGIGHQFVQKGKQGEIIDTIHHQVKDWCIKISKMTDDFKEKATKHSIKIHGPDKEKHAAEKVQKSTSKEENSNRKGRPKAGSKRGGCDSGDQGFSSRRVSQRR